ncbi:MAG: LacI family transcriptional regulator [Oscillibacter sp.]|nr:LacI family transcriptional regulator [Oscillibacter sp.]
MDSTEIARLANVSRTTVSRVLNGHPGVSAKTRQKVERVIRENHYFPDSAARNLVGMKNRILCLFIIDLNASGDEYTISRSQFFYDYIAFAIDVANRREYNLMTTIISEKNMSDIDRLFQSRSISGGILVGDHLEQDVLDRLAAQEHKLVLYNQIRRSPSPNMISVNYDNFRCGQMAAEELLRQGHRNIAFVTGEPNKLTVQDRLEGFETALAAAGIPFDRSRYLEYGAFNRRQGGYNATRRVLQRNADSLPTALCASSATMLMGTFEAIRDMGLRIPEDISLLGIDDTDYALYTTPPLSVIGTSCERVAKLTVSRLIELVERESVEVHDYVIPEVTPELRGSIRRLC